MANVWRCSLAAVAFRIIVLVPVVARHQLGHNCSRDRESSYLCTEFSSRKRKSCTDQLPEFLVTLSCHYFPRLLSRSCKTLDCVEKEFFISKTEVISCSIYLSFFLSFVFGVTDRYSTKSSGVLSTVHHMNAFKSSPCDVLMKNQ